MTTASAFATLTPGIFHFLDAQLALLVSILLARLRIKDFKARHQDRRLITGSHDVERALQERPNEVVVVFMSFDLGGPETPHLALKAQEVLALSCSKGVPVAYPLSGADLAVGVGVRHAVSMVAIANPDGEEELLRLVMRRASQMYRKYETVNQPVNQPCLRSYASLESEENEWR